MTVQVVTALIQDAEGRFLLQRRPEGREYPGAWETPGGKVELSDQNPRAALRRELKEELDLDDVSIAGRVNLSIAFDPPLVKRPFDIAFFNVKIVGGRGPTALDGQQEVAFKHLHEIMGTPWVPSLVVFEAVLRTRGYPPSV